MYVDLTENVVRYCFRTLDDASDMHRKGELSPAVVDRGWPHLRKLAKLIPMPVPKLA